jgi:hypothetical protein
MNQYDELINQADMAVIDDTIVAENPIRLALEYVFLNNQNSMAKTSMVCL